MKAVAVLALLALVAMSGVAAMESTEVADVDFDDLEAENDAFLQVEETEETEDAEADEAEDESDEESEEEAEEEEESEEDSEEEAESEEESESFAETEAVSEVDAEAVAEFESALGENAEGKWHVYSDLVTETAHEGISAAALSSLAVDLQKYIDLKKLKHGVIWNDMPSGTETDEAAMIKDGHMDVDTWTRIFKLTGGVDDLVFNVHYGCLQHWHSMAPIQRVEAKNPAATRAVFKNKQVRAFINTQLNQWFQKAIQYKADKEKGSWYVGHILHAIQDSYPRGHAVRLATASKCGEIISFQGYDAQHGNGAHAKADHSPNHKNKEADPSLAKRYACAKEASADVLRAFAKCAAGKGPCTVEPIAAVVGKVYVMAPGAMEEVAGGSAEAFAKKGIATDKNYVKKVVSGVTLYNPKSTKFWGTPATRSMGSLCQGRKPIISKAPTGFGVYREKDFKQYYDPSSVV